MPNPIDLLTLLCVLAAGVQVGLLGFFGFNAAEWAFGTQSALAYQIAGASTVWQLLRQRYA
jgi:uncharacterized membrane protein YuzA (DUF378 family)